MPCVYLGTIEIYSVQGVIRLRCELDGAELLIDRQASHLFDERTGKFSADHRHGLSDTDLLWHRQRR
jgi:hypothetical protein